MINRVHGVVKTAIALFALEFLISSPAQKLFDAVWSWKPTVPDVIPSGLFAGIGIGLIATLWLLRGSEPQWWLDFDLKQKSFENETISLRAITRACLVKDGNKPVHKACFIGCHFVGPDVAVIFGSNLPMFEDCTFIDIGGVIPLPPQTAISGAVIFDSCLFRACKFERVQLLLPPHLFAQAKNIDVIDNPKKKANT